MAKTTTAGRGADRYDLITGAATNIIALAKSLKTKGRMMTRANRAEVREFIVAECKNIQSSVKKLAALDTASPAG